VQRKHLCLAKAAAEPGMSQRLLQREDTRRTHDSSAAACKARRAARPARARSRFEGDLMRCSSWPSSVRSSRPLVSLSRRPTALRKGRRRLYLKRRGDGGPAMALRRLGARGPGRARDSSAMKTPRQRDCYIPCLQHRLPLQAPRRCACKHNPTHTDARKAAQPPSRYLWGSRSYTTGSSTRSSSGDVTT
jgi:hypothetical protein